MPSGTGASISPLVNSSAAMARRFGKPRIIVRRGVALHAVAALGVSTRDRAADQPDLAQDPLDVDAAGHTELLGVLPEQRLAEAEQRVLRTTFHEPVAALHERVQRRGDAQPGVRIPVSAVLGVAVLDAKQGLVVFHGAVLPRERARGRRAFGDVLLAIHAADERVEAFVELRQRHVHLEAHLGLEAVELVVEQCRRDRAAGLKIGGLAFLAAEPLVHAHGRAPHRVEDAVVRAVDPRVLVRVLLLFLFVRILSRGRRWAGVLRCGRCGFHAQCRRRSRKREQNQQGCQRAGSASPPHGATLRYGSDAPRQQEPHGIVGEIFRVGSDGWSPFCPASSASTDAKCRGPGEGRARGDRLGCAADQEARSTPCSITPASSSRT